MDSAGLLDSWKSIALYLKRSIRTCQRLEREAGLPVHRLDESPKARVYAYAPEIDRWLEKTNHTHIPSPGWRLAKVGGAIATILSLAALAAYLGGLFTPTPSGAGKARPSLVILQLRNETGDKSLDYLSSRLQNQLMVEIQAAAEHLAIISESSISDALESLGLSGKDRYSEPEIRAIMKRTDATHLFLGQFWKSGNAWTLNYGLYTVKGPPVQGFIKNETEQDRLSSQVTDRLLAALGIPSAGQVRTLSLKAPDGYTDLFFVEAKKAERAYISDCDEKDLLRAIELYRQAAASHPDSALAFFGLGYCYQNQYLFHGRTKLSRSSMIDNYRQALHLAPDLPESHLGLGWSHFFGGEMDEAYAWFKEARDLSPFNPTVNYHIGTFLGYIGLVDRAIDFLSKAIDYGERSTRAYQMRALCEGQAGRYRAAANDMAKLLELNPTNTKFLCGHARCLLMVKDFAGAERELDVAEVLTPGDLEVRLTRALLWAARGEKDKALEAVRPAIENPLRSTYFLSGVYAVLGLEEEAVRQMELVLEKGPEEFYPLVYPYECLNSPANYLYDKIRNGPRFQGILKRLEKEYLALSSRYSGL
ncbi:MAG: tetratricopeptide repeat protein [Candidatus Aminicenantes bacterium]|nr:tetratricopeptide repeat protein [Candidatus Aminicenantes bacterium]